MRRGGRHETREMRGTATVFVRKTWDVWHCHVSRAPRITRGHRSELCVKCGSRHELRAMVSPIRNVMREPKGFGREKEKS